MQFMMTPVTPTSAFEKHEPAFKDINEYLKTIEGLPVGTSRAQ